jgi:hypothetical protein
MLAELLEEAVEAGMESGEPVPREALRKAYARLIDKWPPASGSF